jgi:hypothetical protein
MPRKADPNHPPLTNNERQARWKAVHEKPFRMLRMHALIPRGGVELGELEKSAYCTMAVYNKLLDIVERWIDKLDEDTHPSNVLRAFALLAPALESLTILRGKIIEQRGNEADDVTPGQAGRPKIEDTLERMRLRFEENIKKVN